MRKKYVPGWLRHIWQKPYKGPWYYEMQVGPVALRWQHDPEHHVRIGQGFRINRFHTWWDKVWWWAEVKRHWKFGSAIGEWKRLWALIDEEWYFLVADRDFGPAIEWLRRVVARR